MVKEKLTLSVDKDAVAKAKTLGINISEITERVLKGYTSAKKPNGSLYDGYKQLFDSIIPLLREFGINMTVAEPVHTFEDDKDNKGAAINYSDRITLEPDGSFYSDLFEVSFKDIKRIDLRSFLSAEDILSNLVDALTKSEEARKKKLKEILMAKRIIDAMSETLVRKSLKKTEKE